MTKIALLGCGWLGFPLAKQLIKQGYFVNGSTTNSDKINTFKDAGITPFLIDFEAKPDNLVEFLNADILIITVPPRALYYVQHIRQLLLKIEASSIKKVIYTSSISVYGNATGVITEETDTNPITARAQQVLDVEQLLLNNQKFDTTILRLGGLIGANRHPAFHVSGKQLKAPHELINLIHLNDCISIISLLLKDKTGTAIFNLVNPYHPTKLEYYISCCTFLKLLLPTANEHAKNNLKELSSEKICTLLNYQFKNNLILS